MIKFLFKGILRDKSRSLLPVIVVALGVYLTVFMTGWLNGVFSDMIDMTANFTTGHVKIMTRAYAENENQIPNDLALLDVTDLKTKLHRDYPDVEWVERIHFGGLLDVPDKQGETRNQGQATGTAIDFFTPGSKEADRMNIRKSIIKGSLPDSPGEALLSESFSERFQVSIGDEVTLFSSTMNGSMAFQNFIVSGTVRFGNTLLDRGAILIDITDAQQALDMNDAAGEILGYFGEGGYDDEKAELIKTSFNAKYSSSKDEFSPQMFKLRDLNNMGEFISLADNMSFIMAFIFVMAMSVVLWNTGLLGGLRRYNEYGIRLALGEEKKHIYKTTIYEAILIGLIGSVLGTILGVGSAFYLQHHGIDVGSMLNSVTMMMPQVFKAVVTPELFYIGFVPGLFAMVLGNALAGLAIYKRKTTQLFKELEV